MGRFGILVSVLFFGVVACAQVVTQPGVQLSGDYAPGNLVVFGDLRRTIKDAGVGVGDLGNNLSAVSNELAEAAANLAAADIVITQMIDAVEGTVQDNYTHFEGVTGAQLTQIMDLYGRVSVKQDATNAVTLRTNPEMTGIKIGVPGSGGSFGIVANINTNQAVFIQPLVANELILGGSVDGNEYSITNLADVATTSGYSLVDIATNYYKMTDEGGFAAGDGAGATTGGAIGRFAYATNGAAIGYGAQTFSGASAGYNARSVTGAAVGDDANTGSGGAVGAGAFSQSGFAGGDHAYASGTGVQLGTGTNTTSGTLQFLDWQLLTPSGNIQAERLINIDGGFAAGDGADTMSGGAIGVNAYADAGFAGGEGSYAASGGAIGTNSYADAGFAGGENAYAESGGAVGTSAIATSGGAVGTNAVAMSGGAVGHSANTVDGGAVGYNTSSTSGFAGGQATSTATGGAVGYSALATSGGAIGYRAQVGTGGAAGAYAETATGGAVGNNARAVTTGGAVGESATTTSGGAVGYNASSASGFAGGLNAQASGTGVQLGTGTNTTTQTFQVFGSTLLDATGQIPTNVMARSVHLSDYSVYTNEVAGVIANAVQFDVDGNIPTNGMYVPFHTLLDDSYIPANQLSWVDSRQGVLVDNVFPDNQGRMLYVDVPSVYGKTVLLENFDNANRTAGEYRNDVDGSIPFTYQYENFQDGGKWNKSLYGQGMTPYSADIRYLYKSTWGTWNQTTPFRVSAWVKPTSSTPQNQVFNIVSIFSESTTYPVVGLAYWQGHLVVYTGYKTTPANPVYVGNTLPVNVWTFLEVSWNPGTSLLSIYTDGVFRTSVALSGTWTFAEQTTNNGKSQVSIAFRLAAENSHMHIDEVQVSLNDIPLTGSYTPPSEPLGLNTPSPVLTRTDFNIDDIQAAIDAGGLSTTQTFYTVDADMVNTVTNVQIYAEGRLTSWTTNGVSL